MDPDAVRTSRARADRPPVLVLGGSLTALGVIRCLGRQGVRAFVHGAGERAVEWSRWHHRYPGPADAPTTPQGLERLLASSPETRMVLMPASDPWLMAVASRPADPAAHFVSSTPPSEVAATLVDKGRLALALDRWEVPHPRTIHAKTAEEARAAVAAGPGDAFLKPRDSHAFQLRFGVKAFRLATPETALARACEALDAGLEFVIQEYVPGPATCHYFVDGFVDREGVVRALFARRRLRMHPPDFGNSSALVSVEHATLEGAVEPLQRLLAGIRYRGIFSAEFKRDPRDGAFKLLEVNARPWIFVEFAERAGVNVCEMAYRDALGLPVETTASYRVGLRCVHPPYDRAAGRELLRRRQVSRFALLRSRVGAHRPLLSPSDPLPWLAHWLERAAGWLSRRLPTTLSRLSRRR
jgi:D-aspartate ligase